MRVSRSSRNTRDSIGSVSAPFNEGKEFDSLYREFNEMLHFVVRGITFATETAADLEEANEKEEVANLEGIVRKYVDMENNLNIQREAIDELRTRMNAGNKVDLVETFESLHESSFQEYENSTENEKYFQNEYYIEFRQKIWEVNHPDEAMPTLDGNDDDDIVMGQQKESLFCPITTLLFEEPVTGKVCKHTYSKDAILQLIRRNRNAVVCPVAGCDKHIMEHDLLPNKRIERKVARYRVTGNDLMDDVERAKTH
ncbi:7896_t:CDS:2 [Diversispora eburnea]|uniref:7896_t:CDS:1 n=1 Tax=Diversispora eburnea TaxID=1213867 RepID=A0A9N9G097_9GLOM|nr:7896_t:CDS:2 [Diversispora eburnea]